MFKIIELTNLNEETSSYPQLIHSQTFTEGIAEILKAVDKLNQTKQNFQRFYQIYLETTDTPPRILSYDWHYPMGEFLKGEWSCTYDSQAELEQDYLKQMAKDLQTIRPRIDP